MTENEIKTKVIAHRRYLHTHPELGRNEHNTQKYIIENLKTIGFDNIKTINTSVICDLVCDPSYPLIALRADIDALPISEQNDVSYRSQNEGVMHACGHDGHTAILLTTCECLYAQKSQLGVNVRFIFQSDEEGDGGAFDIIEAGYLDEVSAIYGLHIDTSIKAGEIGYHLQQVNAAGDELYFTINGLAAHGAYPHLGNDALVCSANLITSLQTIVSRRLDPLDSAVITIGTIEGGEASNVICKQVKMAATIRSLDKNIRKLVLEQITTIANGIAASYGCEIEIEHVPSYPAVFNTQSEIEYICANAKELGYKLHYTPRPTMGLEDFGYYVQKTPGAFYKLGAGLVNDIRNAHTSTFDFDEQALVVGVKLQVLNCLNYNSKKQGNEE